MMSINLLHIPGGMRCKAVILTVSTVAFQINILLWANREQQLHVNRDSIGQMMKVLHAYNAYLCALFYYVFTYVVHSMI